jgi:hypothetical protein
MPSTKRVPVITLASFSAPLSRRQHRWASKPSLKTMVKVAKREPQPLVRSRGQPDGGEGRLDRVGGAQVRPVLAEIQNADKPKAFQITPDNGPLSAVVPGEDLVPR